MSDEGTRTADEVTGTFLRPGEPAQVLAGLGFRTKAYRSFARAAAEEPYPGAATAIEVSLLLLCSTVDAQDGLLYYAHGRIEALGLWAVSTYGDRGRRDRAARRRAGQGRRGSDGLPAGGQCARPHELGHSGRRAARRCLGHGAGRCVGGLSRTHPEERAPPIIVSPETEL